MNTQQISRQREKLLMQELKWSKREKERRKKLKVEVGENSRGMIELQCASSCKHAFSPILARHWKILDTYTKLKNSNSTFKLAFLNEVFINSIRANPIHGPYRLGDNVEWALL